MTTVKTVDRAIDMLDCFTADQPEFGVTELAAKLSVHKSMVSRLAATLRAKNFLRVDPVTRRYRIGMRIFELGQLFSPTGTLEEVAAPNLRALVRSVGHASHVGVLDGQHVRIVSCVESEQQLQVAVQVGERRAVHATAAGKLFLAYRADDLFDVLSAGGQFPKVGPRTIQSVAAMKKEIAAIRNAGIAQNREESARGIGAVAAPVFGSDGDIVASVTTIFPLSVVDPDELARICGEVRATANKISAQLATGNNEVT
jgi:IclR family KDG regulon transcriptional repressor